MEDPWKPTARSVPNLHTCLGPQASIPACLTPPSAHLHNPANLPSQPTLVHWEASPSDGAQETWILSHLTIDWPRWASRLPSLDPGSSSFGELCDIGFPDFLPALMLPGSFSSWLTSRLCISPTRLKQGWHPCPKLKAMPPGRPQQWPPGQGPKRTPGGIPSANQRGREQCRQDQFWGLQVSHLEITLLFPGFPEGSSGTCPNLLQWAPAPTWSTQLSSPWRRWGLPPGEKYQDSAHSPPPVYSVVSHCGSMNILTAQSLASHHPTGQ